MTLTVQQVAELEVIRDAAPVVLAGADHLDQAVRWVHVSELPDIAHLLNGGELLLTAGTGIGETEAGQRRFIRELAQAGCSGIVLELMRSFRDAPQALRDEAECCGIPLIGLRQETRFVEVTEQVHVAIINERYALLLKADAMAREFNGLALRGGGLKPILERLARVVDNPVILEDGAHQVVDYAAQGFGVEQLLRAWDRHSRAGHAQFHDEVHIATGEPGCAWIEISLRDGRWGRLHAIELGRRLDDVDRLALDRAAAAVSVALLCERDAANAAALARRSLISDALHGRVGSRQEFISRARALGVDLGRSKFGALAIGFAPSDPPTNGSTGRQPSRSTLEAVRRLISANARLGVAAIENDQVLAVVGMRCDARSGEHARGDEWSVAAQNLRATCGELAPGFAVVVGVSNELGTGTESLRSLLEHAAEALRYGLQLAVGGVYCHADLGIHHLLVCLRDGSDLASFVESELAPLLQHDARSQRSLLPTLRSYLATGRNKSETARQLFIERRTLYRRLERIDELLGTTGEDHQRWLRLEIAVQGLDVLNEPSRAYGRY